MSSVRRPRLFAFAAVVALSCAAPSAEERRAHRPARADASSPAPATKKATAEDPATAPPSSASPDEPAVAPPSKPRITSVGQTTWIRRKPEVKEGDFIGYVRTGSSIPLRSNERVKGSGCPKGFYQVEPRGYVCADRTVTETPRDGFREAAEATRGKAGPFPYKYALSDGAPMYNRIPTKKEQEKVEPKWLYKPNVFRDLPKTLRSHEELAAAKVIEPDGPIPAFLKDGGSAKEGPYDLVEQTIPLGAMLSYTTAFEADGRTWLLSSDHTVVPADRVRPFTPSTFRGVNLAKGEAKLPLAWTRVKARPQYAKTASGVEKTGASWPVRTWVELTGGSIEAGGKRYLETRSTTDGGALYIAELDATVVNRETSRPQGVKEKQKWFMIRLTQGTLVAYDDLEPTFVTLVSPGKGGVPIEGRDPVEDSTTPMGAYSVTFKDRAATMSPEKGKDRSFWIQDVPHTQYFDPPFALHAAFWHERFGEFVSAGCVNLSPLDAETLFAWSDPPVPIEWQGATGAGAKENGPTTIVVIRR